MTRLLQILGLAAALTLGGAAASCAFMHDSNPPANGQCKSTDDCFLGEQCTDGGECVPGPQPDAAAQTDGGSDAG